MHIRSPPSYPTQRRISPHNIKSDVIIDAHSKHPWRWPPSTLKLPQVHGASRRQVCDLPSPHPFYARPYSPPPAPSAAQDRPAASLQAGSQLWPPKPQEPAQSKERPPAALAGAPEAGRLAAEEPSRLPANPTDSPPAMGKEALAAPQKAKPKANNRPSLRPNSDKPVVPVVE